MCIFTKGLVQDLFCPSNETFQKGEFSWLDGLGGSWQTSYFSPENDTWSDPDVAGLAGLAPGPVVVAVLISVLSSLLYRQLRDQETPGKECTSDMTKQLSQLAPSELHGQNAADDVGSTDDPQLGFGFSRRFLWSHVWLFTCCSTYIHLINFDYDVWILTREARKRVSALVGLVLLFEFLASGFVLRAKAGGDFVSMMIRQQTLKQWEAGDVVAGCILEMYYLFWLDIMIDVMLQDW